MKLNEFRKKRKMSTFKDFEELEIWQEAGRLYKQVLLLTDRDGIRTDYQLYIQEADGSIIVNIAERFERESI